MKSTLVDPKKSEEYGYPKLRRHIDDKDLVILFVTPNVGTVIRCGTGIHRRHLIGAYAQDWMFTSFEDLPEDKTVILQNSKD